MLNLGAPSSDHDAHNSAAAWLESPWVETYIPQQARRKFISRNIYGFPTSMCTLRLKIYHSLEIWMACSF